MSHEPTQDGPLPREPRDSVMLSATIERFGSGKSTRHRIRDLSATGVRIDQADDLPVRATVVVTVGALEAVAATVMWAKDGAAGLKFATPVRPEAARAKAAIAPRPAHRPVDAVKAAAPTVGWISDLQSPYRKR